MVPISVLGAGINDAFGGNVALRDMGKTIKARVASSAPLTSATTFGAPGFFRAVQFIVPQVVSTPTSSTSFGVGQTNIGTGIPQSLPAGNPADFGYGTFYIPVVVEGVVAGASDASGLPISVPAVNVNLGYLM
jgi:hypothetical protein